MDMNNSEDQEKKKKNEYQKKYYHEKKDKINEQRARRVNCEKCGMEVGARQLYRHKRSKCCSERHQLIEKAKKEAKEDHKDVLRNNIPRSLLLRRIKQNTLKKDKIKNDKGRREERLKLLDEIETNNWLLVILYDMEVDIDVLLRQEKFDS